MTSQNNLFLPVNFHKVFWDKTSADNFWTFVYTGPTVPRYLSVNLNHQKTWHVQRTFTMFKCSNWIFHFIVQGKLFIVLRLWEMGCRGLLSCNSREHEAESEDQYSKSPNSWLPLQIRLECGSDSWWRSEIAGEICDQFKLLGESDCRPQQHTWEIQLWPLSWYKPLLI